MQRPQQKRGELGLILIDDLQMIERDNHDNSRTVQMGHIMRSLKMPAWHNPTAITLSRNTTAGGAGVAVGVPPYLTVLIRQISPSIQEITT